MRPWRGALGLVALLAAVTLCTLPAAAEPPVAVDTTPVEPVQLRYLFTMGDTTSYQTEIDQSLQMAGEAIDEVAATTMRIVMDAEHTVTAVTEDGVGTFEQRVTGVTVNVTMGEQSIPADDLARQLNGLTMSVQMSPLGEVVDVELGEAPDPQTAQMLSLIEESMRRSTVQLPEEPVSIGDSWTREVPLDLEEPGMELDTSVEATYTLLGFAEVGEARCAVLQSDITLRVSGTFSDMGMTSTATGNGTGTGYTYLDLEAGKLSLSAMDMTLDTTIVAEGIELTQAIEMTMNITKL